MDAAGGPDNRASGKENTMTVITAVLTGIHLITAVSLVFLILLHSGKGGLGDMFGGGMQSSGLAGSTLAERNLSRLTVLVALVFAATTLTLVILLGA